MTRIAFTTVALAAFLVGGAAHAGDVRSARGFDEVKSYDVIVRSNDGERLSARDPSGAEPRASRGQSQIGASLESRGDGRYGRDAGISGYDGVDPNFNSGRR